MTDEPNAVGIPIHDPGPLLLRESVGALRSFIRQILTATFDGRDLDGEEIQDIALRCGLLETVPYVPDVHGPNEYDIEPGDNWLVMTPVLHGNLDSELYDDVPPPQ